jgi:hypothetical protein
MTEAELFVIHSSSSEGAWRGLKHCLAAPQGGPLLFWSATEARDYIRESGLRSDYYTIVPVEMDCPRRGDRVANLASVVTPR